MPTPLSSRWTPFYKFVVPLLVFAGVGVGAWRAYMHPGRTRLPLGISPDNGWVFFMVIAVFAGALSWRILGSLVRIELDDDELILSNYRAEIRVPLANVASLSGPSGSNPQRYTIKFEEPTEFGHRVSFLPPMQWSLMRLPESDEVRELRNAWETARAAPARRAR